MQDYERMSIADAVESINKKIFLPDIQRNFVWKPDQVYTLFDSIMRDYPISTMLFWKIFGSDLSHNGIKKYRFVSQANKHNEEDKELIPEKEYSLVLDGQQRLTTFNLVMRGNYFVYGAPYDLYFNILSGEHEDDDGNLFEFCLFNEKKKGEHFFEQAKTKGKANSQKLWMRVKFIFSLKEIIEAGDQIKEIVSNEYDIALTTSQKNVGPKLLQRLRHDKLVYIYPEKENNYDKVLDIFIRTNRGGTVLTYSDLLFSTVKMLWSEARDLFESLLDKLNGDGKYIFSTDFLLKTILVCYAEDRDGVRYKTKNFNTSLIELLKDKGKIKGEWQSRIRPSILLTRDLINDRFWLTNNKLVSSYNALIPIIYWIFKKSRNAIGQSKGCISSTEIDKMRLWLIKALLQGSFGGQADNMLFVCKNAIDESKSNVFPAEEIEAKINADTTRSMQVDVNGLLEKVKYRMPGSYLLLSIAYANSINFLPSMDGDKPEQDHIFSHDELEKANISEDEINNICNIRFVERTDNRVKSNESFITWITNQKAEDREKHLIPAGSWNVSKYSKFLVARKKLLANKFNSL